MNKTQTQMTQMTEIEENEIMRQFLYDCGEQLTVKNKLNALPYEISLNIHRNVYNNLFYLNP